MAALRQIFSERGMMAGTTSSYMATIVIKDEGDNSDVSEDEDDDEDEDDSGPVPGLPPSNGALSDVKLAANIGT